jgi:hypothetical protein
MRRFAMLPILLFLVPTFFTSACDESAPRRIGGVCSYDDECDSGVCGGGTCIDAEIDTDLDGLTNRVEAAVRSNPLHPDSDGDGIADGVEYGGQMGFPIDSDGDGWPDLIESLRTDADKDCIPDQLDARNLEPDADLDYLVETVCSQQGVCAAATTPTAVCRTDSESGDSAPACDYGELQGYEASEVACDGLDNDCDGLTDEDHADADTDGTADCIDDDRDGDDVPNASDNCADIANADQEDTDGDGTGDLCDIPAAPTFSSLEPGPSGRDTMPRLTGLADPNHLVRVFVDDPECLGPARITTTANADSAFNGGVPVFAGRRSTFSAVAENRGGLRSACAEAPFDYTHLTDAPPRPTPPAPATTQPGEILTASNTVTIRLCVLPELVAQVHVIVAGATGDDAACLAPPAANTFPMVLDPDGFCPDGLIAMKADVPLPDAGDFVIRATTSTEDGLTSECTDVARVGHFPDPPIAPTLVSVNPPSPSNDPTLTVRVMAERLTRVALYASASCDGTAAVEGHVPSPAPANGIALPLTVATDAVTQVSARAFDRLGRASPCATLFQHQHLSGQRPPAPYAHPRVPFDPASPTRLSPDAVAVRICTSAAGVTPTLYAATHCGTVGPLTPLATLGSATVDAECPSGFSASGTVALPAEAVTPIAADFTVVGGVRSWCGFIGSFDHHTTPPAQLGNVAFSPESPSSEPAPRLTATTDAHAEAAIYADPTCTGPIIGRGAASAAGLVSASLSLPLQGINVLYATVSDSAGNSTTCHAIGQYELNITSLQPPLRIEPDSDRPTTRTATVVVTVCALRDRTTLLHIDRTGHGLACSDDGAIGMTPTTGPTCPSDMEPFTATIGVATGTLNSNDLTRISAMTLPGPLETASPCRVLADIAHDDLPPAPPVRTGAAPASPTSNPRPALQGTGEALTNLTFFADATCTTAAATPATVVDRDGNWRTQAVLGANTTTSLYGHLRDAAGNTSTCNHLATIVHDDVPPPVLQLAIGGPPETPELAPTATWCGEPGARVEFFRSSGCFGRIGEERVVDGTLAACVGANGGALTTSVEGFPNQDNTLYARSRDAAGNLSPCAVAMNFIHDDIAPAPPEVETPRVISWNSNVVDFDTRGTAEPKSLVRAWRVVPGSTLPADAPCDGELLGSAFADAVGDFAIPVTVPHTEAVSIAWTARDMAGNVSACAGAVDVVGPASARLENLAAYQTTPGLAAGTVAFHRPDGEVYATTNLADETTRATAMVFDGCLIANYWQSNGFPERNDNEQPPPNETLYGIDSVHARPGDDVAFRLRRMPGPYTPTGRPLPGTLNGRFDFDWPVGSFGGGLNFEVKWDACDNPDAFSQFDRPSSPLQSVQCDLGRCSGSLFQIELGCLETACVPDANTGDPCGLTRFTGRARIVGTMFNSNNFVEPKGFTDVVDLDFVGRTSDFNIAGPFGFPTWTECSGDCAGLAYRRAELPVALSVPPSPVPREYVWFQRCRQRRDPQNDEVRRATGHIRVDTSCSTRRTCIEGAEPNCTRWRAEDDFLIFPVSDTFPPDVFLDPLYTPGLDAHAIVTIAWEEGDWHALSATVTAWDFDTSDLAWERRRQPLDPTFDGTPVHGTWPIVKLAFACDMDAFFVANRMDGSFDRYSTHDDGCMRNRTCVAFDGASCVRWQYTTEVLAMAWNIDPATLGEDLNEVDFGPPDAWSEPIEFVWYSDDWRIDVPFGAWRNDLRTVDLTVTNQGDRWASGAFGATNFYGGRPLVFPASGDKGLSFVGPTLLGPGASATETSRLLPTSTMPWASLAMVTDFLMAGPTPLVGQSIHFAGGQVPPTNGAALAIDLPARLVTMYQATLLVGLDVLADPDAALKWRVEPMAHGGAPIDAVIVHTSVSTSRLDRGGGLNPTPVVVGTQVSSNFDTTASTIGRGREGGANPQRQWFWTHVMPPDASPVLITRPRPPAALDAWHIPFGSPDLQLGTAPQAVVVTTANMAGGDFDRFKSELLREVPTFSGIMGFNQELPDGEPLPFVQRLTSGATFSAGLSFGTAITK